MKCFFYYLVYNQMMCILWRLQPMWRPERWWNEKSSLRRLSYVHQQLFLFLPLCVMTHRLSPCNDNSCSWPSGHSVETGNQTFKYYCMYVGFHCHQGCVQEKKKQMYEKLLVFYWQQNELSMQPQNVPGIWFILSRTSGPACMFALVFAFTCVSCEMKVVWTDLIFNTYLC